MVNRIIEIEKVETNSESNITYARVKLDHGTPENNLVVIEFRGDNNKSSLEKYRAEKWEKGGYLVKHNPNFLVDNKKELVWKYFPLEPILTSPQEKISSEEIIYTSALDYRVGMLCAPAKERLGQDIRLIEVMNNNKDELAEFHGNYPIFIDSSRDFRLFSTNRIKMIKLEQIETTKILCQCGYRCFVASNNNADLLRCPECNNTIYDKSNPRFQLPTWEELSYIEVAYRSLQREKEILKNELGHEIEHAEAMDNYYQRLIKQEKKARELAEKAKEKLETELTQEKEKNKNLSQQLEIIQREKQELEAKIETTTK